MFQKYFLNHLYSFASSLLHNLLGYGLGFASRRAIKTKKRGHHENNKQTFSMCKNKITNSLSKQAYSKCVNKIINLLSKQA